MAKGEFGDIISAVRHYDFYCAKQLCERGLGDRNSVRLSVTCVLCDETIEHTTDILIPHKRVIILVL